MPKATRGTEQMPAAVSSAPTGTVKRDEPRSVTALLTLLRNCVETSVGECRVVGEVGSCKQAGSGHIYFTLKDACAQLACVLYRYQATVSRVLPREGMQLELTGRATVWEGRGALQFIVSHIREAGVGSLQQQFEALKNKLLAEGLFDTARKRPLPRYPESVGLITSASGAVIQDMRHRLQQRAPWIRTYLLPVRVQGQGAELGLAQAVRMWSDAAQYGLPPVDYIILARGGGSLEDLRCFNEEVLARAIAACSVPVVSAVGHETDFTIADFVADLRAPTPTAAIELTTPDAATLADTLRDADLHIRRALRRGQETAHLRLRSFESGRLRRPLDLLNPFTQKLDTRAEELHSCLRRRIDSAQHVLAVRQARLAAKQLRTALHGAEERLHAVAASLHLRLRAGLEQRSNALALAEQHLLAASPRHALLRGFALVHDAGGALIKHAAQAKGRMRIEFADGSVAVQSQPGDPAHCP